MAGQILVTDEVFIYKDHIAKLKEAGYEVVREKPDMNEAELSKAIEGKAGYILGGIEMVTEKVLEHADNLHAIVFPGIGYKTYIPAYKQAGDKGVKISNCPDAPTHAVAEWAIAVALMMNRGLLETGRTGTMAFSVRPGLETKTIGIVGYGRIGKEVSAMLSPFKPAKMLQWNRTPRQSELAESASLEKVLTESDIVFLTVGEDAGADFFTSSEFDLMKHDSLLVDITRPQNINEKALFNALESGKVRVASVNKRNEQFGGFPLARWWATNDPSVSFTDVEVQFASDCAVESILNLLGSGDDKYRVV